MLSYFFPSDSQKTKKQNPPHSLQALPNAQVWRREGAARGLESQTGMVCSGQLFCFFAQFTYQGEDHAFFSHPQCPVKNWTQTKKATAG